MKQCAKCGVEKPVDEFYRRASAKDGRASYCKDCQREYHNAWKEANPDKVDAERKRYYWTHREEKLLKNAQWREENRERHRELIKRWEEANPDRVAAKYKRYRERHPEKFKKWQDNRRDSGRRALANIKRRGLVADAAVPGAELTVSILRGRYAVHGWRCYYCGVPLTAKTVAAEHRIPISRGGLNCGANIVPSCQPCNACKGNKTEKEFRASDSCDTYSRIHASVDVPKARTSVL